ncbi:MAG TPA: alkaline phosphatase family protein [Thermoanaerobaculia bacterium]|jgi:tetratricopeptide (TPR) repeat protein|nr:alkaline phosphatase family protein [Thermoanaerobaculia bacterium]
MRSKSALAAAALIVGALLATFVRTQPSGSAMVFRRGGSIAVREGRVYLRPVLGGDRCRVTLAGGRLAFDSSVTAVSASDDELPLRVRFRYDAPATIPSDWPQGDWCGSLRARVEAFAASASHPETADAFLADRRAAGDRIAAGIERELLCAGLRADSVSARLDIPPGFERLRIVPEVARQAHISKPVIFIGLDGADWQLIDEYMNNGSMPNLKRLVATGAGGVLETDYPPLSPLVWTTMMTGVGPLDHAILDFTRFNPYTHDKEPITSDERRAPAIWNMLTYAGKRTAVFGLWATYAAEPVHGLNVSDRLFTFLYSDIDKPAGVVWPPSRQSWSERVLSDAEGSVDAGRMRQYLPSLTDDEFAALSRRENPYADPSAALRRILVETEIYSRLSQAYIGSRGNLPDLTIIYLQGTDTAGHVFAPFSPPKQPQVSQADYDRYSGVPARYFHEIDDLLGRYAEIADQKGATLMIASDHGFFWREGRPTQISSTATATAAKWHRKEGIYVLRGPGITAAPGHPLRGSVRQVLATLLALTGMPALPGAEPPLPGAPQPFAAFDYGQSFVRAAAPPPPRSGRAASEEISKLKSLGYIGSNESTHSASATNDTKTAGAFNNEGLILRNAHRIDDAIAAFNRALTIDPKYASAMWNLSETLFDANRDLDRADALLVAALQNGLADAPRFVIVRSIAYQRSSREDRSLRLLEQAVAASPDDGELRMFRGRYRMDRQDCPGALDDFLAAERRQPGNALAFASAGLAQMCIGDSAAARESFAQAQRLDPKMPLPR